MSNPRTILTFVRCAGAGSITEAARELGITPQAASKHLLELERSVGVRLLNRSTRKLSLTAEGAEFYGRCRRALEDIDDGLRTLRRAQNAMAGPVRLVVTPPALASTLVAPLIEPLQQRHPQISLDVLVLARPPDLVGQGVDVWLSGQPLPAVLDARCIATLPLLLCAAPAYLKRHGTPRTIDDLRRHRWVVVRDGGVASATHALRLRRGAAPVSVTLQVPVAVSANDDATALHAVLDGAGIGYFPPYRVTEHLRRRRLLPIEAAQPADTAGLYLCVSPHTSAPARSRAVANFVFENLSSSLESARGACGRNDCACRLAQTGS